MRTGSERGGAETGEAVLGTLQRGAESARPLLDENAPLRRALDHLQMKHRHAAQSDIDWDKVREELTDRVHAFPGFLVGEGFVGRRVTTGQVDVAGPDAGGRAPSEGGEPMVCIPSRMDDKPIGVVVLYKLLEQKAGCSELDHELSTWLAGHAATAIFASRLRAQSERKLSTVHEFIELRTK